MMSVITPQQFEELLPVACDWAAAQERVILQSGDPLTIGQLGVAIHVGVSRPDRVRLLRVARIPVPTDPILAAAAAATNLISPFTTGLTVHYGIFIRADVWGERLLIAHELVHVAQYERLGGFEKFLRPYLLECITPPHYPYGPMEQEALITAGRVCGLPGY